MPRNEAWQGPLLPPASTVGEYQIIAKLAEGSSGTVYRAKHKLIGKAAAIKVLALEHSYEPELVSRFLSEARIVNQIGHRGIVDIYEFGVLEDGRQYFVMELLSGPSLAMYLERNGPLAPPAAVSILQRLARALDAAHAVDVVHCDLKPENIAVTFDGNEVFPKLLDFGISKLLAGSTQVFHRTATDKVMGTPRYMAPEQWRGRAIDKRSDIWALGVIAFEMLTGELPFRGKTVGLLSVEIATRSAPSPSSVRPDLPRVLDDAVLAMLQKKREERPASAGEAVNALAEALDKPDERATSSPDERRVLATRGAGTPVALVANKQVPACNSMSSQDLSGRDASSQRVGEATVVLRKGLAGVVATEFAALETGKPRSAASAKPNWVSVTAWLFMRPRLSWLLVAVTLFLILTVLAYLAQ